MSNSITIDIPEKHHDFLASHSLAMLTTIRKDGMLSTNPVGFVWNGTDIRISTLKSRLKYKNIVNDSRIAFCVQSFSDPMQYIEIRGHAMLEDDLDRHFFNEQYRRGSGGEEPPENLDPPEAERAIIVLHPIKVSAPTLYSGRFHKK